MRDFEPSSARMPLDQADGLRRLFAGRRHHVLPLVANPHVAFSGVVLDRVAAALAAAGHRVLVVDAAATAPQALELSGLDLSACIEAAGPSVWYLAARGLPMGYVDTRGSAAGFIDAVQQAAPHCSVMLLHAESGELVRLLKQRPARPLLIGADHPESIKHAYASAKLLARRCALLTYDLLLAAPPHSPRLAGIRHSLASCLDSFLGAVLCQHALIDPAADAPADAALLSLLGAQLALHDEQARPAWQPGALAAAHTPSNRSAFR